MNKKLQQFFVRLTEDYKFREEFASTQSALEGYNKAKPYIEGVSFDEFKEGLRIIHDKINHANRGLNESELRHVSGGANTFGNVFKALEGVNVEVIKNLF